MNKPNVPDNQSKGKVIGQTQVIQEPSQEIDDSGKKRESFSMIALNEGSWHEADVDQKQLYDDAISSALGLETVYDIAVSGPYGAGKTFVISSFFDQDLYKKDTIYVSLGTFQPTQNGQSADAPSSDKNEYKLKNEGERQEVEQAILQQLIYHVTPDVTPSSRILRISKISDNKRKKGIRDISVSVLCLVVLLKPDFFNYPTYDMFNILYFVTQLIALGILIHFIGRALIDVFGSIKNIRISKLGTDLGEIVLDQNRASSIFNRYLDEILHFFECTEYEYVVIEDLDRFNDVEIFTRLRSLNRTINNYPSIKGDGENNGRRIRFIYAVKDNLFNKDSRDRTKFFDAIIPIVPVISYSNSEEKINKFLTERGLRDDLNENLIWEVSAFINDMRQVKNIVNEYGIYRQLLPHISNKNRLFAAIVYKNLEPVDFSLFHQKEGNLYALQSLRPILLENLKGKIEPDGEKLKSELEKAEQEMLPDVEDLKRIYINRALEILKISNDSVIQLYNKPVKLEKITDVRNFDALFIKSTAYIGRHGQVISKLLDEIDKRNGTQNNYRNRLIQIEDRQKIPDLRRKIEDNERRRRDIDSFSIQQLLDGVGYTGKSLQATINGTLLGEKTEVVSKFDNSSQLLKFLVIRGYLDDSLNNYLAYFHSDGMSSDDASFVKNLFSSGGGETLSNLNNPEYLLRKLSEEYFERESILHPSLIEALLGKKEIYPKKYHKVVQLIASDKKHFWLFDNFKEAGNLELLVIELARKSSSFFDDLDDKSDAALVPFLKTIIYKVGIERIIILNNSGKLQSRISKIGRLGSILDERNLEAFKSVIEKLGIQFENITDLPELDGEIWDYLYSNNFYALNPQMIDQIIAASDPDSMEQNLRRSRIGNYTVINDLKLSVLISYIGSHPEIYANNVLMALSDNVDESETSVLFFVNNPEVKEETKSRILLKQNSVISKLADVKDGFLQLTVSSGRFEMNWGNLLYYFKINGGDEHLLKLINTPEVVNLDMFRDTGFTDQNDFQELDKFLLGFLVKENLSKSSFERLIKILADPARVVDVFRDLKDKKRRKYILNKFPILITSENISLLEESDSSLFIEFLVKNSVEIRKAGLVKPSWKRLVSENASLSDKMKEDLIHELYHLAGDSLLGDTEEDV